MAQPSKFCFVISPIGEPDSDVRKRADGVLDAIVRPAVEPLGFKVERADHDKAPGIVTESIIRKTIESELVIADLTGLNPNVMYELALRHATGRPVVQVIEHGDRLPFDISGVSTIFFKSSIDSVRKTVTDLDKAVRAALAGTETGNPIIRAAQFEALKKSPGSEAELVAEALRELRTLAVEIRAGLTAKASTWVEGSVADRNMSILAAKLDAYFTSTKVHGDIKVSDIRAQRQYGGFVVQARKGEGDLAIIIAPFAPPLEVTKDQETEAKNEILRALLKHFVPSEST